MEDLTDWRQRCEYWREKFETKADNDPDPHGWESTWNAIEAVQQSPVERGAQLGRYENPLSALFFIIDMGFYPPPELLLALHDMYSLYKAFEGKLTLEEAFNGKPRKGIGNYAARKARDLTYASFSMELRRQRDSQLGKVAIAAGFIEKHKLYRDADTFIDADNFVRSHRRWKKAQTKAKEKRDRLRDEQDN